MPGAHMNRIITLFTAVMFVTLFSCAVVFGAESMDMKQGLDKKQQGIVTISAFTAKGDMDRLKSALTEGLDVGLTVNEIKEVLVQLYAYCGFPRSLNAIGAFMAVLDERQKKGIKDDVGRDATPLPTDKSSLELGTENQTRLAGQPVKGPIYTFAPAIDQFLKGHLFGDIFGRDVLDFQTREIATIAALAAMDGVNPQLQAHFNIGLNTGLSELQIKRLVSVLGAKVGNREAANAAELLAKVLSTRLK
jgi:4-carboxymuconolactone decarboxylase